ncbi:MAG TPA: hypothetical protein VD903_18435, partial [Pseudonocardia sp.]|nr:hypothetical protein [Pseudonocardia sp.]
MTIGVQAPATFALTSAQLGIWNAQRLDPDSPYYLVGDVLEVSGPEPVDAARLAEAVRITTDDAETLRLRVVDGPGGRARPSTRPRRRRRGSSTCAPSPIRSRPATRS